MIRIYLELYFRIINAIAYRSGPQQKTNGVFKEGFKKSLTKSREYFHSMGRRIGDSTQVCRWKKGGKGAVTK